MSEIEKINTLYALGEAQYSGKNLRVTIFKTFLSRDRYNYEIQIGKIICQKQRMVDDWQVTTKLQSL